MSRLYAISFLVLLLCAGKISCAQDAFFSQYSHVPIIDNMAEAGNGAGEYRLTAIHRQQWSQLPFGFVTSGVAFDAPLKTTDDAPKKIGAGMVLWQDQAGKSELKTLNLRAGLSVRVRLNKDNRLMVGFAGGVVQRSISFADLAWDSQYNGAAYDPSLATGETFGTNNRISPTGSVGFLWVNTKAPKMKQTIGYSASHFYQNQSFLSDTKGPLQLRHVLTGKWEFDGKKAYTIPHFRLINQGGQLAGEFGVEQRKLLTAGSRYTEKRSEKVLLYGVNYRILDALVPFVGYEFRRRLRVYGSYDITLSGLSSTVGYQGGFEIAAIWDFTTQQKRRRLK